MRKPKRPAAWLRGNKTAGKRLPASGGFTLIEILVVMVIIGFLAGVALPRMSAIAQRYEIAAQRNSLLSEISALGYRAYSSGQPLELLSLSGPGASDAPIHLPPGWRIEAKQPIRYSFNGLCSGGKLALIGPDGWREDIELVPPLCKPMTGKEGG